MASKRKLDEFLEIEQVEKESKPAFKNSLDSDEEDDEEKEENYDVMHENDLEGVEDGPSAPDTDIGFTAFNMKEELEEGHFDKEGHYHWKKEKEIRDNWLDNIDWLKVKDKAKTDETKKKESDDDSTDEDFLFDPKPLYKEILSFLKPGESVSKALCRLGKGKKKLTSAERWKKKKDPNAVQDEDENSVNIIKLTEAANNLLTRTGNMDVYEETYEQIQKKVSDKTEVEFDMFSDSFDSKKQNPIPDDKREEDSKSSKQQSSSEQAETLSGAVMWELKWSQENEAEVHGPHTSEQMHTWSNEGYFKNKGWVRKIGQSGDFYTASRIDFELYI